MSFPVALQGAAAAIQLQHASRLSSGKEASCRSTACPSLGSRQVQQPAARHRGGRPLGAAARTSAQPLQGSKARRRRQLSARAAAAAEAAEERSGELVPDRQGYRSFVLEGCEFLVAETPDGKLDLRDSYVSTDVDGGNSSTGTLNDPSSEAGSGWRRPEGLETVPRQQQQYQAVPWYSEYQGDHLGDREPKTWVWRYYLVPVVGIDPATGEQQLSFDDLFVLDGKTSTLARCEVHRLAPPDTPPRDLRLRIRDDVVTIDTIQSIPTWEQAVKARINSVPALSELEQQRLTEYLGALEEARKLGTIDETEFETAYDVHWLAGLQAGSAGVQALGSDWEGASGAGDVEEGLVPEAEEDVMGGWDQEMFEDLMGDYDEESEEAADFDDFDSPATDY